MKTVDSDRLVADYLERLRTVAGQLPSARREELVAEVKAHISEALATPGAHDEPATRNVLERLGPPEEIVRAEADASGQPSVPATWGTVEIAAVGFVSVGALVLPVVGPLVGVVLIWMSDSWTTRQKEIGSGLALAPVLLVLLVLLATAF
ncbi:MAG: HAAS signaling domain-containing protein [Actinomycetes bacterium]